MILLDGVSVFADDCMNLFADIEGALGDFALVDNAVGDFYSFFHNEPGLTCLDNAAVPDLPARIGVEAGLIENYPDLNSGVDSPLIFETVAVNQTGNYSFTLIRVILVQVFRFRQDLAADCICDGQRIF